MRRGVCAALLAWAFALMAHAEPVPQAVAIVGAEAQRDLSPYVQWCAADPAVPVETVAANGCRFAAVAPDAKAAALPQGFSRQAFWLRLTLENPGPAPVERWLRVGSSILQQVSFFEALAGGRWRRSDAGQAVPGARRPLFTAAPVLPLTLAAGERRTLWVRVASATSIDLTPTLWQPNAYLETAAAGAAAQALAVGGMLITAVLSLLIFLRDRSATYLYFTGIWLGRALFAASYAFLIPEWVSLPASLLAALGACAMTVCAALFACGFVGEAARYRRHRALLFALAWLMAAATAWTCLIDFRASIPLRLIGLSIGFAGAALFWRAWRGGSGAAGYLFWANAVTLGGQIGLAAITYGAAPFSDGLVIANAWLLLLSAPVALFGLAAHRETLLRALAAAQAEGAARIEFMARMSHELRTPLDTILGTAQLLSHPVGKAGTTQTHMANDLAEIKNAGGRLLRMIDDILDYSRGLAGRLSIAAAPVAWPDFLRGLVRDARRLAAEQGNVFRLQTNGTMPENLCVDEVRLRQVLDNLLRNAARHTRRGDIRVECGVTHEAVAGRGRLAFAVADSGEGIAAEDIERIFRPFERGRQVARSGGKGVGLGLPVARQLVEAMGGHLTVESVLGQGACFRFDLPLETVAAAETPAAEQELVAVGYTGKRRTVLLVEDEAGNRRIAARLLRSRGFTVIEADGAASALALCAQRTAPVDMVLTDQMMPDGDAWSLLTAFASRWPEVPVLLFSAALPARPADFPQDVDFAACLMKPLDHDLLLRRIGELLGLEWIAGAAIATRTTMLETPAAEAFSAQQRPANEALLALRTLADSGQVTAIVEWADALAAADPPWAAFAAAVKSAALRLDFATLTELARPAE